MDEVSREEMLADIRSALAGGRESQYNPALQKEVKSDFDGRKQSQNNLVEQFESEFARIGGKLHRAKNISELRHVLDVITLGLGARKVVAWAHPHLQNSGLFDSLTGLGIEVYTEGKGTDRSLLIREASESDIGITTVDYALADTGTLVAFSAIGRPRCFSLLPPVHVAILSIGRILPGLGEFFRILELERAEGRQLSSAITFISGPSRTADIELTLVVGVHGPQELHVVILDGEENVF